jgi:hypothetical protein
VDEPRGLEDETAGDDAGDEGRRNAEIDPAVGRRTSDALFGAVKADPAQAGAPSAGVAGEASGDDPGDALRRAAGADPAASSEPSDRVAPGGLPSPPG